MQTNRRRGAAAVLATLAAAVVWAAFAAPAAAKEGCTPDGRVHYLCGPVNAEDLVLVPGSRLMVVSGMAPDGGSGRLYQIDAARKTFSVLQPDVSGPVHGAYAGCPGAPDMARFAAHGLALRTGKGGAHLLYAVNHGGRESVEVFKVRAAGGAVHLTWIGCAVMPEGANPNSVAPTPEGGFVVSKFDQAGDAQGFSKMSRREVTGVLYDWRPGRGFREVPNSAFSGDNGVAVSPDGRWVFVNAWPEQRVVRLDRSGKTAARSVKVDFLPDNLRWAPDGRLLVAGQASDIKTLLACDKPRCPHGWAVVALDPKSMKVTPLVREPGRDAFSDATGALMVGDELWVGTYRGDRIAYLPLGRHH